MVLSGAGADGTQGVRAVKEAGGVIMVQEPAEAPFPSVPRNALETGVSDFVATVARLAELLPESALPASARTWMLLVDTLRALHERIDRPNVEISTRAKQDEGAQRLMSIPGVGPMIANAVQALAPPSGDVPVGARLCGMARLDPGTEVAWR